MLPFLFLLTEAFDLFTIPSTGDPPSRRFQTSTVLDADLNQLITYGGYDPSSNTLLSSLATFNLTSKTWGTLTAESSLTPPSTQTRGIFIRSDRKMIFFFGETQSGITSDTYSFDLTTHIWENQFLTGDTILGRSMYAFCVFTYLNITYASIFGGITRNGIDNSLYL